MAILYLESCERSCHKPVKTLIACFSRTGENHVGGDPIFTELGKKHSKSSVQIILCWHISVFCNRRGHEYGRRHHGDLENALLNIGRRINRGK
jgi:hypothetical protein